MRVNRPVARALLALLVMLAGWQFAFSQNQTRSDRALATVSHFGEKTGFLPGRPDLVLGKADFPQVSEAMVVKMNYAQLESGLARSGNDVRIAVSEFETYYEDGFSRLIWSEAVDQHLPFSLEVHESEYYLNGSRIGTALEAEWVDTPGWSAQTLAAAPLEGLSFSEVFAIARPSLENYQQRIAAVTVFRVSVKYLDRDLSYGAAFLWEEQADGKVTISIQDHGIDLADKGLLLPGQIDRVENLKSLGRAQAQPISEEVQ